MKKHFVLLLVPLFFLVLNPAFAESLQINVTFTDNFSSGAYPTYLNWSISQLSGDMLFDALGNATSRRGFFAYNLPYLYPDDLWFDFPYYDIQKIEFDLNIRGLDGVEEGFIMPQTLHSYEDGVSYYEEWGRYGLNTTTEGVNLTELGTGQHHVTIENIDGCWRGLYWYNSTWETEIYDICPDEFWESLDDNGEHLNIDTMWLIVTGYNSTDGLFSINLTVGNLTFTVDDGYDDGTCQWFESDNPSSPDYSPDCRFGGVTGFSAAVGTRQTQIFALVIGALVLISGALSLIRSSEEITVEQMIMLVFGLVVGIMLLGFGLTLVITP